MGLSCVQRAVVGLILKFIPTIMIWLKLEFIQKFYYSTFAFKPAPLHTVLSLSMRKSPNRSLDSAFHHYDMAMRVAATHLDFTI